MNAGMVDISRIECIFCHKLPVKPCRCLICRIYACEQCVKAHDKKSKAAGGKFHCINCWVPGCNYVKDDKVEIIYDNYKRLKENKTNLLNNYGCRRCGVIFSSEDEFYAHKDECKKLHPKVKQEIVIAC